MNLTITTVIYILAQSLPAQPGWIKTYGGLGSEVGRKVLTLEDGGYLVAGSTGSFGSGGDIYMLKLDGEGELEWSSFIGGQGVDEGWDVAVSELGYWVAGSTQNGPYGGYDGLLAFVDLVGDLQWIRYYGGSDWDMIYSISTSEAGLFLVGRSYSETNGGSDLWVEHTDPNGMTIWSRRIGGAGDQDGRAVAVMSDGGCVAAGSTVQNGTDLFLCRLDAQGGLLWSTNLGTAGEDIGTCLTLLSNGDLVAGGSSNGFSEHFEMYVTGFSSDGVQQWSNHTGQISDWMGYSVKERPSGGLVMVGSTTAFGLGGEDLYVLMMDAWGNYQFGTTYGSSENEVGNSIDVTLDGGFIMTGTTTSYGPGPSAVFIVRTDASGITNGNVVETQVDPISVFEISESPALQMYPNPIPAGSRIQFKSDDQISGSYLIDGFGRSIQFDRSNDLDNFVPQHLPSGLYCVTVLFADGISMGRYPLMVVRP